MLDAVRYDNLFTITDATKLINERGRKISRARVSALVGSGRIESQDIAGRKLVTIEGINAFLAAPLRKGGYKYRSFSVDRSAVPEVTEELDQIIKDELAALGKADNDVNRATLIYTKGIEALKRR